MAPAAKDMRRPELVVPYVKPDDKGDSSDINSTLTTTLPMLAMFTRNRIMGWTSVLFALQSWLAETPDQKAKASTPGWMGVGMSIMAAGMTYLPLFLPPPPARAPATGTEAPPAQAP